MKSKSLKHQQGVGTGASRCVICGCGSQNNNVDSSLNSNKNNQKLISKHLHVIFLLKNIFELPSKKLVLFLTKCPNLEEWVDVCTQCDQLVGECKGIYEELLKVKTKLKTAKHGIIKIVREQSGVKEGKSWRRAARKRLDIFKETRRHVCEYEYEENLEDPFILGDLNARGKAVEQSGNQEISTESLIKQESQEIIGYRDETWSDNEQDFGPDFSDVDEGQNDDDADWVAGGGGGGGSDSRNFIKSKDRDSNSEEQVDFESKTIKEIAPSTSSKVPGELGRRRPKDKDAKSVTNEVDGSGSHDHSADKNPTGPRIHCPFCKTHRLSVNRPDILSKHLDVCRTKQLGSQEEDQVTQLCCSFCPQFKCRSSDTTTFVNHLVSCAGVRVPLQFRIFRCSLCPDEDGKWFMLPTFLTHYIHHKQFIYECSKCGEPLMNSDQSNQHWKQNHFEPLTSIPDKDPTSHHRRVTPQPLPEIPWWCGECGQQFTSEQDRDSHLTSEHPHATDNMSKSSDPNPDLQNTCQFCDKEYKCAEELQLHLHISHTFEIKKLLQCQVCCEPFRTKTEVEMHKRRFHKLDMLRCLECGKEFISVTPFKRHVASHKMDERNKGTSITGPEEEEWEGVVDLEGESSSCELPKEDILGEEPTKSPPRLPDKQIIYRCKLCSKTFDRFIHRKRHMKKVHGAAGAKADEIECSICNKVVKGQTSLLSHIKLIHRRCFKFQCGSCGSNMNKAGDFEKHQKTCSGKGVKCAVDGCDRSFQNNRALGLHMTQTHHLAGKLRRGPKTCGICNQTLSSTSALNRHRKRMHKESSFPPEQETGEGGDDDDGVACSVSSKVVKGTSQLNQGSKRQCERCGGGMYYPSELKKHLKICSGKVVKCVEDGCGRTFPSHHSLTLHMGQSHKKHVTKPIVKVASGARECQHCLKTFCTTGALRIHIQRFHMPRPTTPIETPYKCDTCGLALRTRYKLKRHLETSLRCKRLRMNESEASIVCEVCGNRYSCDAYLQRHMKKHEKSYVVYCEHCGQGFYDQKSFKVHLFNRHQIGKKFEYKWKGKERCPVEGCNKMYRKNMMEGHIAEEHKDTGPIYNCEQCGDKFYFKVYLQQHVATKHNQTTNVEGMKMENEQESKLIDND